MLSVSFKPLHSCNPTNHDYTPPPLNNESKESIESTKLGAIFDQAVLDQLSVRKEDLSRIILKLSEENKPDDMKKFVWLYAKADTALLEYKRKFQEEIQSIEERQLSYRLLTESPSRDKANDGGQPLEDLRKQPTFNWQTLSDKCMARWKEHPYVRNQKNLEEAELDRLWEVLRDKEDLFEMSNFKLSNGDLIEKAEKEFYGYQSLCVQREERVLAVFDQAIKQLGEELYLLLTSEDEASDYGAKFDLIKRELKASMHQASPGASELEEDVHSRRRRKTSENTWVESSRDSSENGIILEIIAPLFETITPYLKKGREGRNQLLRMYR